MTTKASNSGALLAYRYFQKQILQVTLVYLAIFAFVMVVLTLTFTVFAKPMPEDIDLLAYSAIFPNANSIYLLVLGIIMPLYLELLLGYGITRRQQTFGLLGASVVVACALAIVNAAVAVLFGEPTLLSIVETALTCWFFFMVGWLIVIGYQYRRVFVAIASTVAGIVLLSIWPLWEFGSTDGNALLQPVYNLLPAAAQGALSFAACLVLVAILLVLTRRIPVKV